MKGFFVLLTFRVAMVPHEFILQRRSGERLRGNNIVVQHSLSLSPSHNISYNRLE